MKRIVLCADDYGQAPHISIAILNLANQQRISAISCLVTSKYWTQHAAWLNDLHSPIDIGLHLNLTEGQPLSSEFKQLYGKSFSGLAFLIRNSIFHRLNKKVIYAECCAQLEAFIATRQQFPRFIDGHQHIHQFPIIRDVLMEIYEKFLNRDRTYIRLVKEKLSFSDIFLSYKRFVIRALGTDSLETILTTKKIPHNQSFTGIYTFRGKTNYRGLFKRFLSRCQSEGSLIMCHPGLPTDLTEDIIAPWREREYQYLGGPQFLEDCHKEEAIIAPF